jgi:hypothetical protein
VGAVDAEDACSLQVQDLVALDLPAHALAHSTTHAPNYDLTSLPPSPVAHHRPLFVVTCSPTTTKTSPTTAISARSRQGAEAPCGESYSGHGGGGGGARPLKTLLSSLWLSFMPSHFVSHYLRGVIRRRRDVLQLLLLHAGTGSDRLPLYRMHRATVTLGSQLHPPTLPRAMAIPVKR